MSKLAIKKLTDSDLTFFHWHFVNAKRGGNQKAINLNADIFIKKLFPLLPNQGETAFTIDLQIYGPNAAPADILARKILKSSTYKNWRLNGESVHNPIYMPNRYDKLKCNDYAILAFEGDLAPDQLKIVLISKSETADSQIHKSIESFMGDASSMRAITVEELSNIVEKSSPDSNHPIRIYEFEAALEDAAKGGEAGAKRLEKWVPNYKVTKRDLAKARIRATEAGELGEEFVYSLLCDMKRNNVIKNFTWASNDNAIQAYDFIINDNIYIDAKSTFGNFEQLIHISMNELLHMRELPEYRIYRIHSINGENAMVSITEPMRDFAKDILDILKSIPKGVRPDSFSVDPRRFKISDEHKVRISR